MIFLRIHDYPPGNYRIPPWEQENHLHNCLFLRVYVSSQEDVYIATWVIWQHCVLFICSSTFDDHPAPRHPPRFYPQRILHHSWKSLPKTKTAGRCFFALDGCAVNFREEKGFAMRFLFFRGVPYCSFTPCLEWWVFPTLLGMLSGKASV